MSTSEVTVRRKAVAVLAIMAVLALVLGTGLLLQRYGPGNMGTGFLQGAGVAVVAVAVMAWRVTKAPSSATTFERAFTQSGDERDDLLLTRALAVLGLAAVPLTGAAAVTIGLGADVSMVLFLLLVTQMVVGTVAFVVIARRS